MTPFGDEIDQVTKWKSQREKHQYFCLAGGVDNTNRGYPVWRKIDKRNNWNKTWTGREKHGYKPWENG